LRVLVTGGTGLLGYWITRVLRDKGFDVYATYHEKTPPQLGVKWIKLDLEDLDSSIDVIRESKPDIIVHAAAYTDVDGCEINKEKAFRVNYLATKALAKAGKEAELFIYISTDYVFDGRKGLYVENDVPAPINYYGLTKLLGEIAVDSIVNNNSCIIRVSGLYGYSPTGKRNFGLIALEKLIKKEPVEAFVDQQLSPTYVKFLAEKLSRIIEKKITGTLHIAGERLSRYEFAIRLANVLGVEENLVRPKHMEEANLIAPRPRDSSLNTSKARELNLTLPSLQECLKDMVLTYREITGMV